jgi:hypothetical protein
MNFHGHGMYLIVLIKFFHFALKCYFISKSVRCFWRTLYKQIYMNIYKTEISKNTFYAHFAKLGKPNTNFVISVYLHGITRLPMDRFSWNLLLEGFSKICRENSRLIKSNKGNQCFTWRPMYIYANISLNFQNEKCFKWKLYRKFKHTFYVQ